MNFQRFLLQSLYKLCVLFKVVCYLKYDFILLLVQRYAELVELHIELEHRLVFFNLGELGHLKLKKNYRQA